MASNLKSVEDGLVVGGLHHSEGPHVRGDVPDGGPHGIELTGAPGHVHIIHVGSSEGLSVDSSQPFVVKSEDFSTKEFLKEFSRSGSLQYSRDGLVMGDRVLPFHERNTS